MSISIGLYILFAATIIAVAMDSSFLRSIGNIFNKPLKKNAAITESDYDCIVSNTELNLVVGLRDPNHADKVNELEVIECGRNLSKSKEYKKIEDEAFDSFDM